MALLGFGGEDRLGSYLLRRPGRLIKWSVRLQILKVILSFLRRRLVKTCCIVLLVTVAPNIIDVLSSVLEKLGWLIMSVLQRVCNVTLVVCMVGAIVLITLCSGRPVDRLIQSVGLRHALTVV